MASQIISRLRGAYGNGAAGIGSNGYIYKNLTFPQELDSFASGQSHMAVFHIWERKMSEMKNGLYTQRTRNNIATRAMSSSDPRSGTSIMSGVQSAANAMKKTGNPILDAGIDKLQQGVQEISPTVSEVEKKMNEGGSGTKELQQTICLYMPLAYTSQHSTSWNVTDLPIKNWLSAKSLTDLAKQGGLSLLEGAIEWMNPVFSTLTGTDLEKVLQSGFGVVRNPWQEQLFERVNFRTFSFNFAFRPRNEKESMTIRNIVQTFKYHMHPEVAVNMANRYWIYPSEFTIEFWANGSQNEMLNHIGACVLTNMSINYADAGTYAAHRENALGAPPAAIGLSLDFTEVELVTKNSIIANWSGTSTSGTQSEIEDFHPLRVD